MFKVLFDTSALDKFYHFENDSENIDKLMDQISEIWISNIAILEFGSAIYKKSRTKEITFQIANEIIEQFSINLKEFKIIEFYNEIQQNAIALLKQYAPRGLRTLDSIQLATAVHCKNLVDFSVVMMICSIHLWTTKI